MEGYWPPGRWPPFLPSFGYSRIRTSSIDASDVNLSSSAIRSLPFQEEADRVILVEEPLFFRQYHFHAKKLVLHRASMKHYAKRLKQAGLKVEYIDCDQLEDTEDIARHLVAKKIDQVILLDPCDDWLERRLDRRWQSVESKSECSDARLLTSLDDWRSGRSTKATLLHRLLHPSAHSSRHHGRRIIEACRWQRSFDPENRKKLPAGLEVPMFHALLQTIMSRKRSSMFEIASRMLSEKSRTLSMPSRTSKPRSC